MSLIQNKNYPADKVSEMLAFHVGYERVKGELLASVLKTTSGKMNTLDVPSGAKWIPFIEENPKKVTEDVDLPDFINKVDADELLTIIEKLEARDQGLTKAKRDIIASDVRYYWTTTEDFYLVAADKDSVIKEKYKSLPTISPRRKTETEIQNAFDKLEAKRNKKNSPTSTDAKV
jgi:hypothetical protein